MFYGLIDVQSCADLNGDGKKSWNPTVFEIFCFVMHYTYVVVDMLIIVFEYLAEALDRSQANHHGYLEKFLTVYHTSEFLPLSTVP